MVHKVPCKNCERIYVGQTKRSLVVQLKEHQRAVFIGDSSTSALAEHAMITGHIIDWHNARVLDSCQQLNQSLILECWYIHEQLAPLNRERGPLPPVYQALVKQ